MPFKNIIQTKFMSNIMENGNISRYKFSRKYFLGNVLEGCRFGIKENPLTIAVYRLTGALVVSWRFEVPCELDLVREVIV